MNAAVIVAHPDDETLWAGGLILSHPRCRWFIASLCRGSDPDRSPKFLRVLQNFRAKGAMADLDDGPEQTPLSIPQIQDTLLGMLPERSYDLILTHAPYGEYTRHRRHEEVSRAVTSLWQAGILLSPCLGLFAYEDEGGRRLPQAVRSANQVDTLTTQIVQEKDRLIRDVYGFGPDSWEARTSPRTEAFWLFNSPGSLQSWMDRKEVD
jgi:LmbE family N-acetylglucosaminyl deacetylase